MEQTSEYPIGLPQPDQDGAAIAAHRVKLFLALAVLVGAMGYFAFMAFQGATVYYLTVGELQERGPRDDGRLVRVSGKLEPDSFAREGKSILANFRLTDGVQTMAAVHEGVLSDLFFNEHSDIILEGTYGADGIFVSENVIVKCPSKYIASG